jgi:hypothetical protein
MYVNGKMRPVETIPDMGVAGVKENDGGDEFNYNTFENCKNFCKYDNVPPTQQ